MASPTETTVPEFVTELERMHDAAQAALKQIADSCAIMNRQTKQLEIALDVMIAIADDDATEMRIRRRLSWALQQMKSQI